MQNTFEDMATTVGLQSDGNNINTNTTSGEQALQNVDHDLGDQGNVAVINAQETVEHKAGKIRTRTSSGKAVEKIRPLSETEAKTLEECEGTIKQGMANVLAVAVAFATIKQQALYRANYRSFDEYCRKNYDVGRGRGYQYVNAGKVYQNLCSQVNTPRVDDVAQLLVLSKLPSLEEQIQALNSAREQVGTGKLTSRILKIAVDAQKAQATPSEAQAADSGTPAATNKRKTKIATAVEPVAPVAAPAIVKPAGQATSTVRPAGHVELNQVKWVLNQVQKAISMFGQDSNGEEIKSQLDDIEYKLNELIEEAEED